MLDEGADAPGKPGREVHREAPAKAVVMGVILVSDAVADLNEVADLRGVAP
jgi:hypothetical protein